MAPHIALLGDSIFDNHAYTNGGPDVVAHLRTMLPPGWRATLFAVDGNTTAELAKQAYSVPPDVSHIVVSIGGNDALGNFHLLNTPVRSTAEALALFADAVGRFESSYRAALAAVLRLRRNTTLCTVYNGHLDPQQAPSAPTALALFNDVILRVAFEHHLAVIELRLVCTEPGDYHNQIEPSASGGRKIAVAIVQSLAGLEGTASYSKIYGGQGDIQDGSQQRTSYGG